MKNIFILFILLSCSSCINIAFLIYGVHKPRPLSIEQMNTKYETLGYLKYPIYVLKDSSSYLNFMMKQPEVNGVLIFNRDGHLLTPKSKMTCSSDNRKYLMNFNDNDSMDIDSTFTIHQIMDNSMPIQDSLDLPTIDGMKKNNIFLCFADFVGRVNKQSTSRYLEQLENSNLSDVSIRFLSLDPLEY